MSHQKFERFADDALQPGLDTASDRLAEESAGIYERAAIKALVPQVVHPGMAAMPMPIRVIGAHRGRVVVRGRVAPFLRERVADMARN